MSGLQKNDSWKSKSTVPMFHRVCAFNSTVSKRETLGCSLLAPSSRLQEASCAPAAVRAEEWELWWRVTDKKWGGGRGRAKETGEQVNEGRGKKQHVEVKITAKHLVKDIHPWRRFSSWANRLENGEMAVFARFVPITDKWAKHLDNNWCRNISNCYSTGVKWPHTLAVTTLGRIFQSSISASKWHFHKKGAVWWPGWKWRRIQGKGESHLPTYKRKW